MEENQQPDELPADLEAAGEESDHETILVKLPSGKTVKMLSPYDDEGVAPWLVPKDERELDFYEISWDMLIDDHCRLINQGKVVVLSRHEVNASRLRNFGNGMPQPDKIFKSRFDTFNGKHLLEAILAEDPPKPEPPSDQKKPDTINPSTEAFESRPDEYGLSNTNYYFKRQQIEKLLKQLQRLQILREGEAPKVDKWFQSKIEKEKKVVASKRRRRRQLKKDKNTENTEIRSGLVADSRRQEYLPAFDEEETLGEVLESGDEARNQKSTVSQLNGEVPSETAKPLKIGSENVETYEFSTDENELEEWELEEEEESVKGESSGSESITFSDMEREEEFLDEVDKREAYETTERIIAEAKRKEELLQQLNAAIVAEREKITTEYILLLRDLLPPSERDSLMDWNPHTIHFTYSNQKRRCNKEESVRRPRCSHLKKVDSSTGAESVWEGDLLKTVFLHRRPPRPLFSDPANRIRAMEMRDALHELLPKEDEMREPTAILSPFELEYKLPFWVLKKLTEFDVMRINSLIEETAIKRGWIRSPYYLFGVDSGLILTPISEDEHRLIEEFKQRSDYESKRDEFGKILEDGVLSEEKMQELILLGVADQDPFLKDYIAYSKWKRDWQESVSAELRAEYDGISEAELEEGENENIPKIKGEGDHKNNIMKFRVECALHVNKDPRLRRWDSKEVFLQTKLRERRMKELTGEIDGNANYEELSSTFEHFKSFAWVHPKNVEASTSTDDENKRRMLPFNPVDKKPTEFQLFLEKWLDQWNLLKYKVHKRNIRQLKGCYSGTEKRKQELLASAFKRRLDKAEVFGYTPQFLVDALSSLKEQKRPTSIGGSYLGFLMKMRKAYVRQWKTDRKQLKNFISSVERFLNMVDEVKKQSKDMKTTSIRKMEGREGEEEEEEEVEGKKDINLKEPIKPLGNITKDEPGGGSPSNKPAQKGLTQNEIEEDTNNRRKRLFAEWFWDDASTHYPVDETYDPTDDEYLMNYMALLNIAKIVDRDPYDLKFLSNREYYMKPIYYIPDGSRVPIRIKDPGKNNESVYDKSSVSKNEDRNPFFSEDLIKVWRSRLLKPDDNSVRVSDLVGKFFANPDLQSEIRAESIPKEEQDSGIQEAGGPQSEPGEEREYSGGIIKPWTCPPEEPWVKFEFDAYACLRKLPRVGRKEREWYRSSREREQRAFRRDHVSFVKFVDINKLKGNPEGFNMWKVATSGKQDKRIIELLESFLKPFGIRANEMAHRGAGEFGQPQMNESDELEMFKSTHFPKEYFWRKDETENSGTRTIKTLFGEYKLPKCFVIRTGIEPKEEAEPPRSYIAFSSITLPPLMEFQIRDESPKHLYTDQKVEDRKLFKVLQSCGTLIFDITRSRHDLYVCCWYLRKLLLKMEKLKQRIEKEVMEDRVEFSTKGNRRKKEVVEKAAKSHEISRSEQRIILITSFLSWANSPDEVKGEMNEKTFYNRKPHADYFDFYTFENLLYRIGRRKPYNISTTILFTGLPFGFEEDGLAYVFKMAYENSREIPIYGPGENLPPMIHIYDLNKVVITLMKADKPPLMTFAVHPTDIPLKSRIFNIATQISYAHVRTFPTTHYEWNNILPKMVHDMLQLNVPSEAIENHPIMENPKIANPFSFGSEGYPLMEEIMLARGISAKRVVLLGPPTRMKLDMAHSISVFYNIPLLTRRNIMREWLKLLQQIKETATIYRTFNASEDAEHKDEALKSRDLVLEEMKQVVNDKNNCDVNRKWLLITLQIILRTVRYRRIGYVLCDFPLSEKDAEFLFNNRSDELDPRPFDFVAESVSPPTDVIYVDNDSNDALDCSYRKLDSVLRDDWNEFLTLRKTNADAQDIFAGIRSICLEFFKKRLFKIHRVKLLDEFVLEKIIKALGPPKRPGGAEMYEIIFSRMVKDKEGRSGKAEEIRVERFFNAVQQDGLDLAAGVTHQCFPELKDWPKQKVECVLHNYFKGVRDYPMRKQVARSAAGPYREVRRRWAKKSTFFNQMPTEGNRVMWRKARKFWAPQNKTQEYLNQFEADDD